MSTMYFWDVLAGTTSNIESILDLPPSALDHAQKDPAARCARQAQLGCDHRDVIPGGPPTVAAAEICASHSHISGYQSAIVVGSHLNKQS